jgi:hypothetical protein
MQHLHFHSAPHFVYNFSDIRDSNFAILSIVYLIGITAFDVSGHLHETFLHFSHNFCNRFATRRIYFRSTNYVRVCVRVIVRGDRPGARKFLARCVSTRIPLILAPSSKIPLESFPVLFAFMRTPETFHSPALAL